MSEPIYIRLKAHGLDCWHLVDVKPTKLPLLKKLEAGEAVNVADLGRVLASGWGEPPSPRSKYQPVDA